MGSIEPSKMGTFDRRRSSSSTQFSCSLSSCPSPERFVRAGSDTVSYPYSTSSQRVPQAPRTYASPALQSRDIDIFQTVLSAQGKIRRKIASAFHSLDPDEFDPEEFEEELEVVAKALKHDRLLAQLLARVPAQARSYDRGF